MNLKREIDDANRTKNLELSATQAKLKLIVHASKYSPKKPFRRSSEVTLTPKKPNH